MRAAEHLLSMHEALVSTLSTAGSKGNDVTGCSGHNTPWLAQEDCAETT